MDPNAAVREINASADRESIAGLLAWKRRGGFRPSEEIEESVARDCDKRDRKAIAELRAWIAEAKL